MQSLVFIMGHGFKQHFLYTQKKPFKFKHFFF